MYSFTERRKKMVDREIYLGEWSYMEAKIRGYIETYRRPDWKIGDTVDIYHVSHYDVGMMGTVTEFKDDRALVEVW